MHFKYVACLLTLSVHGAASSNRTSDDDQSVAIQIDQATSPRFSIFTPRTERHADIPLNAYECAQAVVEAVYTQPCGEKFCTQAIANRLERILQQEPEKYKRIVQQLAQKKEHLTRRGSQTSYERKKFNPSLLREFMDPELMHEIFKAWKDEQSDKNNQIEQHTQHMQEQEDQIRTQETDLRQTRYKFYASLATAILGGIGTIVTAWISSNQC